MKNLVISEISSHKKTNIKPPGIIGQGPRRDQGSWARDQGGTKEGPGIMGQGPGRNQGGTRDHGSGTREEPRRDII